VVHLEIPKTACEINDQIQMETYRRYKIQKRQLVIYLNMDSMKRCTSYLLLKNDVTTVSSDTKNNQENSKVKKTIKITHISHSQTVVFGNTGFCQ